MSCLSSAFVHVIKLLFCFNDRSNMSAAALRARGHLCVLEETREWNIVELVVSGEVVFTCNIKDLEFGKFG